MGTEALANPLMLEWARRASGLEPEDVARKAGVKIGRVSEWERDERRPTITQLRKLADIYKRPLGFFFLEEPPPEDPLPADFRRLDREPQEPFSPELRLAIRMARARRESALELFEELSETPHTWELRVRISDDAERVGERLRTVLGIPSGPIGGDPRLAFNRLRAATEKAGVLVFQAEKIEVTEMRGFSIAEQPVPVVVLNIKDAPAARSFSLLHELTHVALNRSGICLFEEIRLSNDEKRVEVFCNRVAGASLLPAESLLQEPETPKQRRSIDDDALDALALRYGASPEAVLRRLVDLKRVSSEVYDRKRPEFLRRYERLRSEQKEAGGHPPRARMAIARAGNTFIRLVLEAYDEERITASDVADLLGERLEHLDRIRSAVQVAPESSA